jgi:hypothetical protein
VKVATGSQTNVFTFNLGSGQTFQDTTSSRTITGSGTVALISMRPSFDDGGATIAGFYDLLESVTPGWKLTAAGCVVGGDSTGTPDSPPDVTGGANVS